MRGAARCSGSLLPAQPGPCLAATGERGCSVPQFPLQPLCAVTAQPAGTTCTQGWGPLSSHPGQRGWRSSAWWERFGVLGGGGWGLGSGGGAMGRRRAMLCHTTLCHPPGPVQPGMETWGHVLPLSRGVAKQLLGRGEAGTKREPPGPPSFHPTPNPPDLPAKALRGLLGHLWSHPLCHCCHPTPGLQGMNPGKWRLWGYMGCVPRCCHHHCPAWGMQSGTRPWLLHSCCGGARGQRGRGRVGAQHPAGATRWLCPGRAPPPTLPCPGTCPGSPARHGLFPGWQTARGGQLPQPARPCPRGGPGRRGVPAPGWGVLHPLPALSHAVTRCRELWVTPHLGMCPPGWTPWGDSAVGPRVPGLA